MEIFTPEGNVTEATWREVERSPVHVDISDINHSILFTLSNDHLGKLWKRQIAEPWNKNATNFELVTIARDKSVMGKLDVSLRSGQRCCSRQLFYAIRTQLKAPKGENLNKHQPVQWMSHSRE